MNNHEVSVMYEEKIRSAKTVATVGLFLFFIYIVALVLGIIALRMVSGIVPADEEAYRLKRKVKNRAWLAILIYPVVVLAVALIWILISSLQNR